MSSRTVWYKTSSRTPRAVTPRNPVSKNEKQTKKTKILVGHIQEIMANIDDFHTSATEGIEGKEASRMKWERK